MGSLSDLDLRVYPLLQGLPDEELARVAPLLRERRYRKGTILFNEGDPGDVIYFVKEGKVRVTRLGMGGQEQVVKVWGPESVLALVVLADRSPYPSTGQVMEDSVLLALRVEDVLSIMSQCPTLMANAFRLVGQRLRLARDVAHDLAVHSTHGRLAHMLLQTAEERGSSRFDLGLTHQDIAGIIGTSRETVTRVLADFRRTGCIRVEDEHIVITNADKLREWME